MSKANDMRLSGLTVGVLALQGDFAEHAAMLKGLGASAQLVRLPQDLEGLHGIVIPGGESTTLINLMQRFGLDKAITSMAHAGKPVMGTCAGLVIMSREVSNNMLSPLGLMDVTVRRNGYGRQIDSFELDTSVSALEGGPFHAVFIRAPRIERVGQGVEILATLPDGEPIAVRQKNLLGLSFHPEMTNDTRLHEFFLAMTKSAKMIENNP